MAFGWHSDGTRMALGGHVGAHVSGGGEDYHGRSQEITGDHGRSARTCPAAARIMIGVTPESEAAVMSAPLARSTCSGDHGR